MRTQNFIFLVSTFMLCAAWYILSASAFNGQDMFTCDQTTSQFLASQITKRRVEGVPDESECGVNETLHIPGVTNYCLDGCDTECVCKPGYIRTNRKGCILLEEHGMKCNNSEVVVCGVKLCEKTCDLTPHPLCELNYYICRYTYYCGCQEGYIRINGTQKCIPNSRCPARLYEKPAYEELQFGY
ncbi:hypothetical protein ACKWTF_014009 [Chironomus riparius]